VIALVSLDRGLHSLVVHGCPVADPQTWNDLAQDMTLAESLATFCRLLKIHLFRKSFPDHILDIS